MFKLFLKKIQNRKATKTLFSQIFSTQINKTKCLSCILCILGFCMYVCFRKCKKYILYKKFQCFSVMLCIYLALMNSFVVVSSSEIHENQLGSLWQLESRQRELPPHQQLHSPLYSPLPSDQFLVNLPT